MFQKNKKLKLSKQITEFLYYREEEN